MPEAKFYIYILSNKTNKVLYTGMTDNICRRVLEHKLKINTGFTSLYNVEKLVYFETCDDFDKAVIREQQIKTGSRKKKVKLINNFNNNWHDLYSDICS
jgi:putative endonuclease